MSTNFLKGFAQANLDLEVLSKSIRPANRQIFQMDVERKPSSERFRIWRGHESNHLEVLGFDPRLRQVVMLVTEPRRRYEQTVPKSHMSSDAAKAWTRNSNLALIRETPKGWVFARWTIPGERHYLCGMDEAHLFIAQAPYGSTVREAHEALKPEEVKEAERRYPGRVFRQGEWFFVPLEPDAEAAVEASRQSPPPLIRRNAPIGGNGRPHVADEIMALPRREIYARGRVRHPDHRTLVLERWHRVFVNREIRSGIRSDNGVYWVD